MSEQNAAAVPLPQERLSYPLVETPEDIYEPSYIEDEAFYPDEASSTVTPRGLRHNKYALVGTYRIVKLDNPISTHELSPAERAKVEASEYHSRAYEIYVSPGTSAGTPILVSVLFAVGTELRRFGLRSLFQQPGRALIRVPGIEAGWSGKPIARAWGIGVDAQLVDALLGAAGFAGASWKIHVLAGYSTGYRGLSGTILNAAANPGALDLSQVSTVVVYDCLYRGDQPAPGQNTKRALEAIDQNTGRKVQVAVYEVTPAGTPRNAAGDTSVSQAWLTQQFAGRYRLHNLKPLSRPLGALICARFLEAASADGYLKSAAGNLIDRFRNPRDEHIARLVDGLPTRWKMASTAPAIVPGTTLLQDWSATHQSDIALLHQPRARQGQKGASYGSDLAFVNGEFINRFNLAGWRADMGERLHDSFIPEFGYERLLG